MFDTTLSTALAIATLIALAAGLGLQRWQLGRLHARLSALEQRAQAGELAAGALAGQIAPLRDGLAAASALGAQTQARQSDLAARIEVLETQGIGDQPYGDAIRLVRQGAREARLVDELGLSPIEASLIVRLHGVRAAH